MKRFREFIYEDFSGAMVEPISDASTEAKRLGLTYAGFGRYKNPETDQVTHIIQNDKLIPYNKAIKTNTFNVTSGDDIGDYTKNMKPQTDQTHASLINYYGSDNYDEKELGAIEAFSADPESVNRKLMSLPSLVPADQLQMDSAQDTIPGLVGALDSCMNKLGAPDDFLIYVGLDSNFDISGLQLGSKLRFKTFRSGSLDPAVVLDELAGQDPSTGKQAKILQILVKKDAKGMYIDDYSTQPGQGEFVLPRGAVIRITSDPNRLVGSNRNVGSLSQEIIFINAEYTSNK